MAQLKEAAEGFEPDIFLAIKTIYFDQEILLDTPARWHIHLSFDDLGNSDNISKRYLKHEPDWDVILTTKQHNVSEIISRGSSPFFMFAAYDPSFQFSIAPYEQRRYDGGFIGASRPDRSNLPKLVADKFEGKFVIVGPKWRNARQPKNARVEIRPPAMGADYTTIANDIRMGLVLLNSENRDQHTNRTFETPAVGQLAFLQDTQEHRLLFEDGVSAVFFKDIDDAISKMNNMSGDVGRAARIAEEGLRTITQGSHTYADRVRQYTAALP